MVSKIRELVYPDLVEQTHRAHQHLRDIVLPTDAEIDDVSALCGAGVQSFTK